MSVIGFTGPDMYTHINCCRCCCYLTQMLTIMHALEPILMMINCKEINVYVFIFSSQGFTVNLVVPLVNQTLVNTMEHAPFMGIGQTAHAQLVGLALTVTLMLTNVAHHLVETWAHVTMFLEAITAHVCQDLLGDTVTNMWMSVLTILARIKVRVKIWSMDTAARAQQVLQEKTAKFH